MLKAGNMLKALEDEEIYDTNDETSLKDVLNFYTTSDEKKTVGIKCSDGEVRCFLFND